MQMEMEHGGKLFFDLFVAMCNHMVSVPCPFPSSYKTHLSDVVFIAQDDLSAASKSPKSQFSR
jgi:hypothetical protein